MAKVKSEYTIEVWDKETFLIIAARSTRKNLFSLINRNKESIKSGLVVYKNKERQGTENVYTFGFISRIPESKSDVLNLYWATHNPSLALQELARICYKKGISEVVINTEGLLSNEIRSLNDLSVDLKFMINNPPKSVLDKILWKLGMYNPKAKA
jgi:hypothetical protein